MRRTIACAAVVIGIMATSAPCGPIADLFKKAPKPKPEERVPELLIILKTDLDEHKRANAAEELRQCDPAVFTDVVPMLIDAARSDPSASVRTEALQSLAKFRPISSEIGQLLELAEKDPSMRVKIQARTSLVQYHLAGYHSPKKGEQPPLGTIDRLPPTETVRRPVLPGIGDQVVPASGTSPMPEKQLVVPPVRTPTPPVPMPVPLPKPVEPEEQEGPPLEMPK